DVDVHAASADQPVLLREVVVELVVGECRTPGSQRVARLAERVVLVAAAADGTDGAPVGVDEHLRADALRRRALRADDGHERDRLAAAKRLACGGQDFLVQIRTSILAFFLSASMNSRVCASFFCWRRNSRIWPAAWLSTSGPGARRSVSLMT